MNKFPVIIILILTCIWFYVCWYWYTCQLKGFCYVEKAPVNAERISQLEVITEATSSGTTTLESNQEVDLVNTDNSADKEEVISETTEAEREKTSTGAVKTDILTPKAECIDIVTSAISLGGNNNVEEVKKLEKFLKLREGETELEIDGRYSQEDFEAVKRFQLKYKEDILDPWGIESPTGYVYKTTMETINKKNCEK